ncbi:hypothetical protein [Paenibacillus thiaminolyticus]|uniref:hypothetical protein n=1 Tax=Paenibacillus thiaminolyticus TaxID=49283 RepID=UPI0025432135|nr:hypothetical protein [Paenibacillus thiaminolyticus]WII37984.1 hypothetical protein O0V01_02215 [Paenibacillus thiaminolyticus]
MVGLLYFIIPEGTTEKATFQKAVNEDETFNGEMTTSQTDEQEKSDDLSEIITLNRSDNKVPELEKRVIPLDSPKIELGNVIVKIIGIEFGEDSKVGFGLTTNDIEQDIKNASEQGFQVGFTRSFNKEASKRDASVALYINAELSPEVASPRDVEELDVQQIALYDDQGSNGIKLYNSFNSNFLKQGEEQNGLIRFAVYSDSNAFFIEVGDTTFKIANLPYAK